jgi:hypothetical protein
LVFVLKCLDTYYLQSLFLIFYDENKQIEIDRATNYYNENKDLCLEKKKKYYKENSNKIKQYKKQYSEEQITCECGSQVSRNHLARHRKTNKHQSFYK